MSQSHHKTLARSPKELRVRGDYMEIWVERIVLDATVCLNLNDDDRTRCVLMQVVYSNLWEHRIEINNDQILVDSGGFQHATYVDRYESSVRKAKQLKAGTELSDISCVVEGQAKVRGWIAFPSLGKSVVPHRLISSFRVFDPGCTSGYVRHTETLELIFDLSLYGRLLQNGKKPDFEDSQS